jgi:hypothetical protein
MIVSKSHLRRLNGRDVADLVFLHLLTLHLMKQEFYTREFAVEYAKNTWQGGNFFSMRADRTDLYNLLYLVVGTNNNDALQRLQDPDDSKDFLESLNVDREAIRRYLRLVATNKTNQGWERRFFLQLQTNLRIETQGYRAIRQIVTHYDPTNYEHKRLVITRLLMAFRARAIRSDMYKRLVKYAKTQHLEIKDQLCNPETGKGCGKEASRQAAANRPGWGAAAVLAGITAGAYMWGKSQGSKE